MTEQPEGPINVDFRGANGVTALAAASYYGYLDIVKMLVRLGGADPSIKDDGGFTALFLAAQESHLVGYSSLTMN